MFRPKCRAKQLGPPVKSVKEYTGTPSARYYGYRHEEDKSESDPRLLLLQKEWIQGARMRPYTRA